MRLSIGLLCIVAAFPWATAQTEAPTVPSPTPATEVAEVPATDVEVPAEDVDPEALYEAGKAIWESYVPAQIREEYEFPSKEEWMGFFAKLQTSLDQESFAQVAELEPEVKKAVASLDQVPLYAEYLDWLRERLDFVEAAKLIATMPPSVEPTPTPSPGPSLPAPSPLPSPPPSLLPTPSPELVGVAAIPHYSLWYNRLRERPRPASATELMPSLKAAFAAEGLPPALAWIAEVESSLNPKAKSPAGAQGLFQLMPATAKSLGLSTFPFDERSHPEKSAQAAARHLKALHRRFGNWPLALAAYNAGDGRISRALKKQGPNADFAAIAPSLSVETRMYVPKVLATIHLREGVNLATTPTATGAVIALR